MDARQAAQVRAAAYGGSGNGSLTYLDTHDLKPVSLFNAAIGGAFSGAVTGGLLASIPILMARDTESSGEEQGNTNSNTNNKKELLSGTSLSKTGLKVGVGITIASAVIGAVRSVIKANIHNKWAEKMTRLALEQQHSGDLTHAQRLQLEQNSAAASSPARA